MWAVTVNVLISKKFPEKTYLKTIFFPSPTVIVYRKRFSI